LALKKLQNVKNQDSAEIRDQIRLDLIELGNIEYKTYIMCVPAKTSVIGNEKADELAKKAARVTKLAPIGPITTISHLRKQIDKKTKRSWRQKANKDKHYVRHILGLLDVKKAKKGSLKSTDKLTFATFMQIQLGHEYFRRTDACRGTQTLEHVMLDYKHYRDEQSLMKRTLEVKVLTMKILFSTQKGIACALDYLT